QKLNALAQQQPAATETAADSNSLASLKLRISELKKHSKNLEQANPVPKNVVSLSGAAGKLKVNS
ncbi:MAG TPA: hypothetical protein VFY01_12605, partial [Rheinheimera sp.]|nr:hypothetical protein [Rheinheimera sp.]